MTHSMCSARSRFRTRAVSRTSASTKGRSAGRLWRWPRLRLSSPTARWPEARKARTACEPMYPAAPVTRTFIGATLAEALQPRERRAELRCPGRRTGKNRDRVAMFLAVELGDAPHRRLGVRTRQDGYGPAAPAAGDLGAVDAAVRAGRARQAHQVVG